MRRLLIAGLLTGCLLPLTGRAAGEDRALQADPPGIWRGELEQGQGPGARRLTLALRISRGEGGRLTARIDGLIPGVADLQVSNLNLVEDVLSFQVPQADSRFAGNFYGDSLRGNWSQGDASWPIIFFRDEAS